MAEVYVYNKYTLNDRLLVDNSWAIDYCLAAEATEIFETSSASSSKSLFSFKEEIK